MKVKVLEEIWSSIDDFPNYEVSSFGNVKNIITDTYKSCRTDAWGYKCTDLYNLGKQKTVKIHKLVAEAFICKRPENKQVNHIDGNKKNNCLDNLEWVTPSENIIHAFETGLIKVDDAWIEKSKKGGIICHEMYDYSGENNPSFGIPCSEEKKKKISESNKGKTSGSKNANSKLKEEDVLEIRNLYITGKYKQSEIGKMFNVDQTIISGIVLRKTWRHVL